MSAPRAVQSSVPVFTASMKSAANAPMKSGSVSGHGEVSRPPFASPASSSSSSSSSTPVYSSRPSSAALQRPTSAVPSNQHRTNVASTKHSTAASSSSSTSSSELEALRERERQKKLLLAAKAEPNEKEINHMKKKDTNVNEPSSDSKKKNTHATNNEEAKKPHKNEKKEKQVKKENKEKKKEKSKSNSKRKRNDEAGEGSESEVSTEDEGSGDSMDEEEERSEDESEDSENSDDDGSSKKRRIDHEPSSEKMATDEDEEYVSDPDAEDIICVKCHKGDHEDQLMLCDGCNKAYHAYCVGLKKVPDGDFYCKDCPEQEVEEQELDVEYEEPDGTKKVKKEKFKFTIVDDVKWVDEEDGVMDEEDEPDDKDAGDKDDEDEKAETDAEASSGDSDDDDGKKKVRKEKMAKKKKSKSKAKVAGKVVEGEASAYSKEEIKTVLDSNAVKRGVGNKKTAKAAFNNFLAGILLRSGETDPEAYKQLKLKPVKPDEVQNWFGVNFDAPPKNPPKPKGAAASAAAAAGAAGAAGAGAKKPQYQQKVQSSPATVIPPISQLRLCPISFRDGCKNYFHEASKKYYQFDQGNTKWSEITGSKLQQIQANEKKARSSSAGSDSDD